MVRTSIASTGLAAVAILAVAINAVGYADNSTSVSQHNGRATLPVSYQTNLTNADYSSGCSCGSSATGCDSLRSCACQASKPKPANPCATSHKGLFYNNDFSYLEDPCY